MKNLKKISRTYSHERQVLLRDVRQNKTLRIDSILHFAQDVGRLDTYDLGVAEGGVWFARHMEIFINDIPKLNDNLVVSTYCDGISKVSAVRKVDIFSQDIKVVSVSTEWVHFDVVNSRPKIVPSWIKHYGDNLKDFVRRYIHFNNDEDFLPAKKWQMRKTDFDMNDHVNNARICEIIESNPNAEKISKIELQFIKPCTGDVAFNWNKNYSSLKITQGDLSILNARIEY